MTNKELIEEIRQLVAFAWHERNGNHYGTAEHKVTYDTLAEVEIKHSAMGWQAQVTYPFCQRYVAAPTIEETKAILERRTIDQLVTCAKVGYLFADKIIEMNNR